MTKKQTTSSKRRSQDAKKKSSPKPKDSTKTKPDLQKINANTSTSMSQSADVYTDFANGISVLLEEARHLAARSVNAILTATYWEMGRRIVDVEQNGKIRAEYGTQLLLKLSQDLTAKFGRGFSVDNLERMRMFFSAYSKISATLLRKSCPARILPESGGMKTSDAHMLSEYLLVELTLLNFTLFL